MNFFHPTTQKVHPFDQPRRRTIMLPLMMIFRCASAPPPRLGLDNRLPHPLRIDTVLGWIVFQALFFPAQSTLGSLFRCGLRRRRLLGSGKHEWKTGYFFLCEKYLHKNELKKLFGVCVCFFPSQSFLCLRYRMPFVRNGSDRYCWESGGNFDYFSDESEFVAQFLCLIISFS